MQIRRGCVGGSVYDQDDVWGERTVDSVSTDVLRHRVGAAVKIEDMTMQNLLQWYGHVIR